MNILPVSSLLIAVLSIFLAGQTGNPSYSQNVTNDTGPLPIPELQPRDESSESDDSNAGTLGEPTPTPAAEPVTDRIAAQFEFEPNEVLGEQDYFDVSNFAFNTMQTSELCPTGNCEFELDDGQMFPASGGDRLMSGKLRIDDGESTKIMNLNADWQAVEEREGEDGETTQIIEGTLGIGREEFNPDFEYRINGTMTSDGPNYIVAVQGER